VIDIENKVFDTVSKALEKAFKNISVSSINTDKPATFPYVSIVETSNSVDPAYIDSGRIENASNLLYTVNVYSNLAKGKKTQAKKIRSLVSDEFDKIGMVRTFCQPIENLSDTSIYRITMRFECKVDTDEIIYRR
jgi:hypothetical protein